MKKALRILLVTLVAATLLSGCGKPPADKVSEARNLIDAVIAAGGEEFAPQQVLTIKKKYREALEEIDAQDRLLFKNYAVAQFTLNQLMDECDLLRAKMAESRGEAKVAVVRRIKAAAD